jgi:hypothetical protein
MIYGAPFAFVLTRTGANPPDNPGEGEILSHLLGRFLFFALGDQPHITLAIHVDGTSGPAWRKPHAQIVQNTAVYTNSARIASITIDNDVHI